MAGSDRTRRHQRRLNRQRLLSRLRQRRHKQLVKEHRRIFPVPGDGLLIDFLVDHHWLSDADAVDVRKTGAAIGIMLAEMVRSRVT